MKINKKISLCFVVIALLVFSLISCGSNDDANSVNSNGSKTADYEMNENMVMEEVAFDERGENYGAYNLEVAPMMGKDDAESNSVVDTSRKIILNSNMAIETLEFDKAISAITNLISSYGGYIESSNVYGSSMYDEYPTRSAFYRLRIPKDGFDKFKTSIGTIGNILSTSNSGQDITASYFDSEAHVKTLKIQEERLLEILQKADKIEDVIVLERELSEVRYEIEGLTGTLKRWDNMVSYATLEISIQEVFEIVEKEVRPVTFSEKISNQFNRSLRNLKKSFERFTIYSLGSIPYLIIFLPVVIIIVLIIMKARKKDRLITKTRKKEEETKAKKNSED